MGSNRESDAAAAGTPRRPTMRDVGERAGVSFKTVSRVVNGEPGVSPELVARVQTAVDELGYARDHVASVLRRSDGRTGAIAAMLEDIANPFSAAMHRAIVDEARPRDVMVLAASSDEDPRRERAAIAMFVARRVDGLVLMATPSDHGWLRAELQRGMPIVAVDRVPIGLDVDSVVADNREGSARAVTHLVQQGHRRIALLADMPEIDTARQRCVGYADALRAAGLDVDERLVRTGLRDGDAAGAAVVELLTGPEPPTAIFGAQNLLTIGAVRALRELGLRERVALVGFDDFELADLLVPAITVVAQDATAIGREAARCLFARIDGDGGPARHVVVPTRLIPRGSGEIVPPA